MKKAAIYARFSSNNQRQESIFHQVEKIKQYANDNGIEIVETYVDEAESGTTDQRTNFLKMINDAPLASWKYIIVYKMDRLSRNVADALNYKKLLANLGVKIISVIEDFDTDTPEGGLFNLITMGLSQYYVENMKRETMAGIMQNAKTARHSGGRAPLGYIVRDDLHYDIDPIGAEAVRLIFNSIAENKTYTEITKELKSRGYKTIEGNDFRPNFIDIVSNRKYIGEYVYNRTASKDISGKRKHRLSKPESEIIRIKGAIPPIIDEELFNKVQTIIQSRKKGKFHTWAKSKYLLSGRIQCGICKKAIVGNVSFRTDNRSPLMQYRCQTKGVFKCSLKALNMLYLDNFIISFIKQILLSESNSKGLKNIVEKELLNYKNSTSSLIDETNKRLDNIDESIKQINTSLVNGNKAMEKILYYELKQAIIEKELLEKEIEQMRSKKMPKVLFLIEIKNLIRTNRKFFKSLNNEDYKTVIAKFIRRIKLTNESVIVHVPLDLFLEGIHTNRTIAFSFERDLVAWPNRTKLNTDINKISINNDTLD